MRKLSEPPFEDFDEHDSPTEPMSAIILSPRVVPPGPAGNGNGTGGYNATTVPVPRPPDAPFPHNGQPAALTAYPAETPGIYPVLPPLPPGLAKGRPPGGAGFLGERKTPVSAQPRNSSVPSVVGMLFVAAQLVLLARVVLSLFGVPASNLLVGLLYAGGTVLAWPLRLLVGLLPLPAQMGGDLLNYLAALLAILVYGVLARVLVRFLKALLNSR